MRRDPRGKAGRANLVAVGSVELVNHPVNAGHVNRLARWIRGRRRVRVVRPAGRENCQTICRSTPRSPTSRRSSSFERASSGMAADSHVLQQNRRRVGDRAERNLPSLAQACTLPAVNVALDRVIAACVPDRIQRPANQRHEPERSSSRRSGRRQAASVERNLAIGAWVGCGGSGSLSSSKSRTVSEQIDSRLDAAGRKVVVDVPGWQQVRPRIPDTQQRRTLEKRRSIREIVFGVQDGILTTLGIITGVGVAEGDRTAVFISGFLALLAGALSMGVGEYLGRKVRA